MTFHIKHLFFGIIAFLLLPFFSFGQKSDIRGHVLDKQSGEPIIFTNVIIRGTILGATTDINGFYSISDVKPGNYELMCTTLGFDTAEVKVTVKEGQIVNQNLTLKKRSVELSGVEITAQKQEAKTQTLISTTKVTAADIQRIPSIGGEADIAQYLQVIPGVISTGDQGGELFIRGGAAIETKITLDGMTIYNPFHSIGLFSVFETDIIRNANVLTGGFNAEYGGRLSAVIDVTTRDGNKKDFTGKISVNPFLSKVMIEGPLKKLDENGSSISYIFNAKSSYLDKTSKTVYPYVDKNTGLPYSFDDYYGKLSFNAANGSKFNIFGFDFKDNVNYQGLANFKWKTFGIGSNFVLVPGASNSLIGGHLSYSDYKIDLTASDDLPRTSEINGFDLGVDFTYFLPKNGEVKYGFDISGYKTAFNFTNPVGLNINFNQNTTELSGYVLWKKIINRLIIEPSLRLQYYASLPAFSPEPRIAFKYNLTEKIRLKLAGGIYSQTFISTKSDKDVVDLFTGFLTSPDGELTNLNGQTTSNNLQRSYHAVFGVESDITKNLDLTIEPYYKYYGQLVSLNRDKVLVTDPDFQIETGKAYGVDFLLKYNYKHWYASAGYSLGYVNRNDGEQVYPPYYDRRHNANVVISYSFGKKNSWQADARWNFGSGFPFTKIQGNYENIPLNDISSDYTTENGDLGTIYDSKIDGGRLPTYHRLDLDIKKTITFSRLVKLEINASVINAYNRANIFYFDPITRQRVNQLPILPAIGLSLTF